MKRFLLGMALLCASAAMAQDLQLITATSGPLNLYVSTTGSDGNACTSAATPCLTSIGVLGKVPKIVRHPVEITYAAGSYVGAVLGGFVFDNSVNGPGGAWIRLNGTLVTYAPATGSASGTSTGMTIGNYGDGTVNVLTLAAAGWTTNDFKGKLLTFTSGNRSGKSFPIVANDATTITFSDYFSSSPPASGDKFTVQEWGTKLHGGGWLWLTPSGYGDNFAFANVYAFQLFASGTPTENYSLNKVLLTTTGGGYYGAAIIGSAGVSITNVSFTSLFGPAITVEGPGDVVLAIDCVFAGVGTNTKAIDFNDDQFGDSKGGRSTLISQGNFAYGGSAGGHQGFYVYGSSPHIVSNGDYFLDLQRALWTGPGNVTVTQAYFKNNQYGMSFSLGDGFPSGGQSHLDQIYSNAQTSAFVNCNGGMRIDLDHVGGSGNAVGVIAKRSCVIAITANTVLTSTQDIQLDTANYMLTDLRGASPTMELDAKWGSRVVQ